MCTVPARCFPREKSRCDAREANLEFLNCISYTFACTNNAQGEAVKRETFQATDWESDDDLKIEGMLGPSTTNDPWSPWWAKPPTSERVPVGLKTKRVAQMAVVPAILFFALFRLITSDMISGSTASSSQQSVDILALENDVGCLVDIAWSPNGQQVAILGYKSGNACADESYVPAQLTIYNVSPAAVLSRIQIDKAIIGTVHPWTEGIRAPAPTCNVQNGEGIPGIKYYNLLWSQDGQRLAMQFSAAFPPCSGSLFQIPHAAELTLDMVGKRAKVVQFSLAASAHLTPLWDSEQAPEMDDVPASPSRPYGYSAPSDASGTVIAMSPDGRKIASYSYGGEVELYDSASGSEIASLPPQVGTGSYSGRPLVMRWSPDGTRLLLASSGLGSVTVWESSALQS